ncbi:MAG TPA: hypothetical protein VJP87_13945 [Candidatus Acidoferrales bacterium]|nr:hypothetical protein [Candidatus Acidoferrales bacterium]
MSGTENRVGLAACAALLIAFAGVGLSASPSAAFGSLRQGVAKSQNSGAVARHQAGKSKQKISASAVSGRLPAAPPETPAELLEAGQLARRVPEIVKQAILASIKASNLPTTEDLQGGFHEESGVGGEAVSGNWVNSPGKPGPYFNPAIDPVATMDEIPADQKLRNRIARPEVFWHVHPAGIVKLGTLTYFWEQAPSDLDRAAAAPGAINIVIGARDQTIYFFNCEGPVLTLSLEDFLQGSAGSSAK